MVTKKVKAESAKRRYAPEQKARLVLEIISGKRTVAEIARTERIKDSFNTEGVDIPYNFLIGRYPVTNTQYAAFVNDGGYGNARWWDAAIQANLWWDGVLSLRTVFPKKKATRLKRRKGIGR